MVKPNDLHRPDDTRAKRDKTWVDLGTIMALRGMRADASPARADERIGVGQRARVHDVAIIKGSAAPMELQSLAS
jgi:hypothetical protein